MSFLSLARFEHHLREIVSGAAIAFVIKAAGAVAMLGFHVLLTRSLGPNDAGIFFLSLTIVTVCAVVGRVGLDNTLVRFIARGVAACDWAAVKGVYGRGMGLAVTASSLMVLALLALAPWLAERLFEKPDVTATLRWMAVSVLPVAMMLLHANALKGLKRILWASLLELQGVVLAGCAAVGFLVLQPWGSLGAAWAYTLAAFVAWGLGVLFWRRATPGLAGVSGVFPLREVLDSSIPLLWVAIMNFFIVWTGSLSLGVWGSNEDISVFNVASRTAMLITFVLFAVNSIAAPKFAALHAQGSMAVLERTARQATVLVTILACPVAIFFLAFPGWVMSWFGPDFAAHGSILVVLALGQCVNAVTGPVGHVLMMSGHERLVRNNLVFATVLNVILNLVLVPNFGVFGAAVAATLTLTVKNLVATYLAWSHLGIQILPILRRSAAT